MILVTGATGGLGRDTIDALLATTPATKIAALARDVTKAADLAAQGVDVRPGNYDDYSSLVQAFQGIDTVLLVSALAFSDRVTQHHNVIDAAREAGVKHLFYTSMQRDTNYVMPKVTVSDLATEAHLKASGLGYTILRNGYYFDALPFVLGHQALETEVLYPAGAGRVAFVSRTDLGAATAALLTSTGHDKQEYTLNGGTAYSFAEIAQAFSELTGRAIAYAGGEPERYLAQRRAAGFPEAVAQFFAEWGPAIADGQFARPDGLVERLLGRRPTSLGDFLKTAYSPGI
ncbi:MAG: SDR family oxidoreductase [Janthinobacterium lividum]